MKPKKSQSSPRGFALIVTLSLMVLLTVIAVGLLTLSSISLRSSTQSSAKATAQANARLALMIAIGQLQIYAGPDQRTTATADLAGGAGGIPLVNGGVVANIKSLDNVANGLSSVQNGTRYWTGIWKNKDTPDKIYVKTPSPDLVMQWLVSGNEVTPKTVNPATARLNLDGTVTAPTKTVLLAGSKSVGNKTTDPNYYVAVPLVDVKGVGTTASLVTGRYGWWVGDEGVKAKFNLVAPYDKNDMATYKNFSTQRSGWEVVNGFSNYPQPGTPQSTSLSGVVSMSQSSLLTPTIPSSSLSFHSATTDSFGVLADSLQGGLRLDLTNYLQNSKPSPAPTFPNTYALTQNIIPPSVTNITDPATSTLNLKGPKWSQLKDFSEMIKNSSGNLQVKSASSDSDYAIAPLIVDFRLLLGAKLVNASAEKYKLYPCGKIVVTLANPYSYPLKWDGLDLQIKNSTPNGYNSRLYVNNSTTSCYFVSKGSESSLFTNAYFHIPSATLPVGGAVSFTMGGGQGIQRSLNDTGRIVINMVSSNLTDIMDFNSCLALEESSTFTVNASSSMTLDVREEQSTAQINVELKDSNDSDGPILRVLERFELDNNEFTLVQRKFGLVEDLVNNVKAAQDFTKPFPIQLFSFQISQPGMSYEDYLANSTTDLGLRASTLRTYTDFNLQATHYRKPIISYNPVPYFMEMGNSPAYLPWGKDGTSESATTGPAFFRNLTTYPLHWGRGVLVSYPEKTVLFSPPANGEPIVSLAQLQHADLTADDISVSVSHQPGNAFGNSYASPFVTRDATLQNRTDYKISGFDTAQSSKVNYYDMSYLLNAAIWDTYFCSTIPTTISTQPLNPKIIKVSAADESSELRDGAKASSHLLINGAFNVNSTSKDAWKAFLSGSKYLKHPAETSNSTDALFARSLGQTSPGVTNPSGTGAESFSGFRRLSDPQIDILADEITKQVRLRGPFLSISQFVNRALVPLTTNKELSRSGALQSALDKSGLNISPDGANKIFTNLNMTKEKLNLQFVAGSGSNTTRADLTGTHDRNSNFTPSDLWAKKSTDQNPGSIAGILADKEMLYDSNYRPEQGFRSTGIPGWLTQADLLQVIGPSIATRSDTFKIRTYGEALDSTGRVIAKAWCEAIVQRIPDYTDIINKAYERDTALNVTNKTYGRKINIASFRWLSSDEI